MLGAMAPLPLLMAVFAAAGMYFMSQWNRGNPAISELRYCLMYLDRNVNGRNTPRKQSPERPAPEVEREALEIYIAGRFRSTIADRRIWSGFMGLTIPQPHRRMAERIIAERPAPVEAELSAATATLAPVLKEIAEVDRAAQAISPATIGLMEFTGIWLLLVALPGLIAAAAFRRGLTLLMFGVDCVTRQGVLASRPRMVGRTIVFNSPLVLAPIAAALVSPLVSEIAVTLVGIVAVLAVITAWSSLLPVRGLTDRLAGTYLVPR
jgi:hypothetical protein